MARYPVLLLLSAALMIRAAFLLWGAEIYFGTPDYIRQGDTLSWVDSILNLIYRDSYSANLANPNGWFYRPPGYSFFIGIIYFIAGRDLPLTLQIIPWVQIVIDTASVYLIYRITLILTQKNNVALIAGFIYMLYPFSLIWTAVAYAESLSIFLLFLTVFFLLKSGRFIILSGFIAGLAVLTRLQIMFIIPFITLAFLLQKRRAELIRFIVPFILVYGMWPVRNLVNHNRLLFSQDIHIGKNWSEDYLAFMNYIFSVQTDHKPQFDQIVFGTPVTWPRECYLEEGDSLLLAETVELCRKCGTGFSYFMTYRIPGKDIVDEDNCDAEIAARFNALREKQVKNNAFHYYIEVPLGNLRKCFFKSYVYKSIPELANKISVVILTLRTILIFAGLLSLYFMFRSRQYQFIAFIIAGFSLSWYFYLSFIYRNIEIRYLLPADVLLLLPCVWMTGRMMDKIKTPV
jgi:hypothetical protein